jgi:hypothetical protein
MYRSRHRPEIKFLDAVPPETADLRYAIEAGEPGGIHNPVFAAPITEPSSVTLPRGVTGSPVSPTFPIRPDNLTW